MGLVLKGRKQQLGEARKVLGSIPQLRTKAGVAFDVVVQSVRETQRKFLVYKLLGVSLQGVTSGVH
jgi:hypothetical protein